MLVQEPVVKDPRAGVLEVLRWHQAVADCPDQGRQPRTLRGTDLKIGVVAAGQVRLVGHTQVRLSRQCRPGLPVVGQAAVERPYRLASSCGTLDERGILAACSMSG